VGEGGTGGGKEGLCPRLEKGVVIREYTTGAWGHHDRKGKSAQRGRGEKQVIRPIKMKVWERDRERIGGHRRSNGNYFCQVNVANGFERPHVERSNR